MERRGTEAFSFSLGVINLFNLIVSKICFLFENTWRCFHQTECTAWFWRIINCELPNNMPATVPEFVHARKRNISVTVVPFQIGFHYTFVHSTRNFRIPCIAIDEELISFFNLFVGSRSFVARTVFSDRKSKVQTLLSSLEKEEEWKLLPLWWNSQDRFCSVCIVVRTRINVKILPGVVRR